MTPAVAFRIHRVPLGPPPYAGATAGPFPVPPTSLDPGPVGPDPSAIHIHLVRSQSAPDPSERCIP